MFKKKKSHSSLPEYGQGIPNYTPVKYRLLEDSFIEECYRQLEEKTRSIIETTDQFTLPDSLDSFVAGQMQHVDTVHREDAAQHERQVKRIRDAMETRKAALDRQNEELKHQIDDLNGTIEPLKNLNAQFELSLGRFHISLGIIVTLLAIIVDTVLNYTFLESVLYQNQVLLMIATICMALMSDFSMYLLGNLFARGSDFMPRKWMYNASCIGLFCSFLLTVVASVMIRVGTMDITFLEADAYGNLVSKASYSLADWGITLITSFLTTCTAIFSFAASNDKNAYLVATRRRYEAELAKADAQYQANLDERKDLEQADDPATYDQATRAVAERRMAALQTGLLHRCRDLLATHQNDPNYTAVIFESAAAILANAVPEPTADPAESEDAPSNQGGAPAAA